MPAPVVVILENILAAFLDPMTFAIAMVLLLAFGFFIAACLLGGFIKHKTQNKSDRNTESVSINIDLDHDFDFDYLLFEEECAQVFPEPEYHPVEICAPTSVEQVFAIDDELNSHYADEIARWDALAVSTATAGPDVDFEVEPHDIPPITFDTNVSQPDPAGCSQIICDTLTSAPIDIAPSHSAPTCTPTSKESLSHSSHDEETLSSTLVSHLTPSTSLALSAQEQENASTFAISAKRKKSKSSLLHRFISPFRPPSTTVLDAKPVSPCTEVSDKRRRVSAWLKLRRGTSTVSTKQNVRTMPWTEKTSHIDGLYGGTRQPLGFMGLRYHGGFRRIWAEKKAEPLPWDVVEAVQLIETAMHARGLNDIPLSFAEAPLPAVTDAAAKQPIQAVSQAAVAIVRDEILRSRSAMAVELIPAASAESTITSKIPMQNPFLQPTGNTRTLAQKVNRETEKMAYWRITFANRMKMSRGLDVIEEDQIWEPSTPDSLFDSGSDSDSYDDEHKLEKEDMAWLWDDNDSDSDEEIEICFEPPPLQRATPITKPFVFEDVPAAASGEHNIMKAEKGVLKAKG